MITYIRSATALNNSSPTITGGDACQVQHDDVSKTHLLAVKADSFFEINKYLGTPTLDTEKNKQLLMK